MYHFCEKTLKAFPGTLFLLLFLQPLFGQSPIAYWTFEDSLGTDSIGSRNLRPPGINLDGPGLVGNYQTAIDSGAENLHANATWTDSTSGRIPGDKEMSVEFLFRTGDHFDIGDVMRWAGGGPNTSNRTRFLFRLTDRYLEITVGPETGSEVKATFMLEGVGRLSPDYYKDQEWHHIVVTYSTAIGRIRLYVDGQNNNTFTYTQGPSAPLLEPGALFLHYHGQLAYDFNGDLDEVAVYDEVLSPAYIYQHYLEANSGSHYSFSQNLTAQDVPPPAPVEEPGFNPLEFAPGYPNVDSTSLALLKDYPGARYQPNHQLPYIAPWIKDLDEVAADSTHTVQSDYVNAALIQEELMQHYHYMLMLGGLPKVRNDLPFSSLGDEITHYINLENQPQYSSIPRFLFTFWNHALLDTTVRYMIRPNGRKGRVFGYIRDDSLNIPGLTTMAGGKSRWSPAAPIDSLQQDGMGNLIDIAAITPHLSQPQNLFIMENGEALKFHPQSICTNATNGTFVNPHWTAWQSANGNNTSWQSYVSAQSARLRRAYSDVFSRDSLGLAFSGQRPALTWYNIGGVEPLSVYEYQYARTVNDPGAPGRLDGKRRSTPYYYPQRPGRWLHGVSSIVGMNRVAYGRTIEIAAGDSLMNPFISPGFTDGLFYSIRDDKMIRPGQYLGILKHLAMLGADTYTNFMVNDPTNGQEHKGNWRIWKTVVPAYAQGITSRVDSFLYQGAVMEDSLPAIIQPSQNGSGRSYLSFLGNSLDHYITARELGNGKFVLVGSTSKSGRATSNGQISDTTTILFGNQKITFPIRLQGSTYILDTAAIGGPIFYQLDRWHEWKEPTWWCRDFIFDAEAADVLPASVEVKTETGSANAYDFSDFTSFLSFSSFSTAPVLDYSFKTKVQEQDTLWMWVLARAQSGQTGGLQGWMDSNAGQSFGTISGTSWQWYGLSQSSGGLFSSADHVFHLSPTNEFVEIDRVLLKRGSQPPVGTGLQASFFADSTCFGGPVAFLNQSVAGDGCVDYLWEFGDGTRAYEFGDTVFHTYQSPGTYIVNLSLTSPCTDSSSSFSDTIVVVAPQVYAGEDMMVCPDSAVTLQGQAPLIHHWDFTPGLDSAYSLNPTIQTDSSAWYYLNAYDPVSGCSGRDSVEVVVVRPALVLPEEIHVCQTPVELLVEGAYSFEWKDTSSMPSISDPYSAKPEVEPLVTTRYWVTGYDACGCDSASASILVVVEDPSMAAMAWAGRDTICDGDTVQLNASGMSTFRWGPASWVSDSRINDPIGRPEFNAANSTPAIFRTRTFTVTGYSCQAGGNITLSVPIVLKRTARLQLPDTLTTGLCDSVQLVPIISAFSSWIDSFAWSTTFGMIPSSGLDLRPYAKPTHPTLYEISATTNPTGCPVSDQVWVIPRGTSPDTVFQCAQGSLQVSTRPGTSYSWAPSGAFNNSSIQKPIVALDSSGWISSTVMDSVLGCSLVDSIWVEVSVPVEMVTSLDSICRGESIQLQASGATQLRWIPGGIVNDSTIAEPIAFPQVTTDFVVFGIDSSNCITKDSVTIVVFQPPAAIIQTPDTNYCEGVGLIQLEATQGQSYSWSPSSELNDSSIFNPKVFPSASTYFQLMWEDSTGCIFFDSVFVEVFPRPTFLYQPANPPCIGEEALVETTGGVTFLWQPGGATTSYFIDSIFSPTTVSVSIGDSNGCIFQESVLISPDTSCCVVTTADTIVDSTHISTIQSLVNSSSSSNPITVQVRDVLIIDQSGPFEYINFAMDPDARIVIHDQFYATFNYCHFYSSCGVAMWDGIYFQSSNSGITLVAGTLSDAENGIVGDEGQPIVSNKMVFDRNHIAVQLGPHYGTYPFTMQKTIIECSDTSLMLPPHALERGAYGVKADSVDELQVGVSALFQENTFDNLEVGVYSYETSLTLKNNVFQNFDYPAAYSPTNPKGVAVLSEAQPGYTPLPAYHDLVVGGPNIQDKNHFNDCRTGVWARHNLNVTVENNVFDSILVAGVLIADCKNRTIDVKENKMTEARLGVVSNLNMNASMRIQKNDITYHGPEEGTGVLVDDFMFGSKNQYALCEVIDNDVQAFGTGIRVNGIAGAYVENNLVTMDATTDTNQWFIGVHVSGGKGEMVRGNEVYNATGIPDSLTSGIWMENTNEAAVACNVVDGFGRLIVLEGQQANSDLWRNDMSNAVDGLVLWNASLIAEIGGYKRPQDNRWVGGITGGATNCLSTDGRVIKLWYDSSGGSSYFPTPNDSGFVPGSQTPGFAITDTLTSGISNSCSSSLTPPSNKVEKQIAEGSYPISGDSAKTQSLNNQYLFPKLKEDAQLLASDPVFQDAYDSLQYTNIEALYAAEEHLENNQLASALLDYQTLTPSISVEACLKHPNTIYLEKIAAGQNSLSANDLSMLEMIAAYCPDEEGYGVYQARSILRYLNPLRRWNNHCIGNTMKRSPLPNQSETEVISDSEKIKMFPNPTTDQVFFENLPEGGGTIKIRNLLGQVVLGLDYQEAESRCQGKVENLSNGSYLVVITSNGGIVFKEKLIIQR